MLTQQVLSLYPDTNIFVFSYRAWDLKISLGNGYSENRESLCISHCFLNVQVEKLRGNRICLFFFFKGQDKECQGWNKDSLENNVYLDSFLIYLWRRKILIDNYRDQIIENIIRIWYRKTIIIIALWDCRNCRIVCGKGHVTHVMESFLCLSV